MGQNHASIHFTPEQWTAVGTAFTALREAIEPVLVSLGADQRRRLVKMGDGSEPFCRQALEVMTQNSHLMPRSLDIDEMRRDLETHDALQAVSVQLTRLMERVRDTDTALGSDVMMAALEGYAFLKVAGKTEGVEGLRKQLGRRFEANGQRGDAAAEAEPDPAPALPEPATA
ncbi:hypothetical protein N799_00645 [Lysobacter arseniciresistens ZS79]|uniref:Uncharacterized protein n=1 Tax=Lysobacter arseniciresistens ZS79 TaxID=913325 RepID=A0A0A0F4E8_9GAMM|nr:hypothetical protein [Lysobacter arseniciresistens]KGM57724.1 hypothetical protein N799_00645 [Lysobacter arseniciresistens ZS79]